MEKYSYVTEVRALGLNSNGFWVFWVQDHIAKMEQQPTLCDKKLLK